MENGIPHHLKPYLEVTKTPKDLNDEFIIVGNIKCTCGEETFTILREKYEQSPESKEALKQIKVLFEKHRNKKNKGYLSMMLKKGKWYITDFKEHLLEDISELQKIAYGDQIPPTFVEAACSQCGQKILIFNSEKHGYDALISEEKYYSLKEFKTQKKSKCRKCGSQTSKIIVKISSTGKNDLFTESGDFINDGNWEDAFDWLTINLKCSDCGKDIKKYLDVETM